MKDLFSSPKGGIPGIGKKNKGISLYGKASHDVTKGKVSDVKVHTLKGNPWKTDNGVMKRIVGK